MAQHRRIKHVLVAIALGGSFIAGVASWPATAQNSEPAKASQAQTSKDAIFQKVTIDIQEQPLLDAIATLQTKTGVGISLDRDAMAALNISERMPVSLSFGGEEFVIGLRKGMAQYGLTCIFRDEKIVVTPPELEISLARLIDVDFDNVPLADALKHVGKLAQINIVIDSKADNAPGAKTTVTRKAKQLRVRELLPSLLGPHGLTYLLRDEVVLITDPQQPALVTRVYPVHDMVTTLVNWKDEKAAAKRAEKLRQFILSTVETKTWTESKGRGSIEYFAPNQSFVVTQTQTAHEKLTEVLVLLRRWNEFNDKEIQVSDVEAARSKNQTFLR